MSNNEILRFRMNIGTGISCFIGAIGGIYLLFQGVKLLSKVSDRRHRKWRKSNELCPVCKNQVKLDDHINCVTCQGCSKIICRKPKCSDWIPKRGESDWECKLCFKTRQTHYKAGEWLLQKLNEKFHINGKLTVQDSSSDSDENFKDSLNSIPLEQKEKVREFLEDLLAEMVGGGTLDNVTVGPLQKSEEYLPLWDHECPGVSHINLKRKIQHIISEASKLSSTLNTSSSSAIPAQSLPYFDPKKYNELLATAVLNKIIDSYHNPANLPYPENSSGVHSGASDLDSNHNDLVKTGRERLNLMSLESELAKHIESGSSTGHPRTFSMGIDETDESPLASPPNSIATYSSSVSDTEGKYLESYIHKHKDRLPLPDLNNESESNDEDLQSLKSNDTDATWEDNWLFKSRKLKGESNNSIAMLVPSPTEEVKALIGDKNADEVSDLSEAEGDVDDDDVSSESSEEEHTESADIPNVLIQNKTIIGGKNHLSDLVEPKPEPEFESLTLQSLPSEAKNSAAFFEEDYVKISRRVIEIENSAATSSTDVVDSYSPAKISPSTLQDKDELSDEDLMPDAYRPTPAPRKSSHADISLTLNTDIAPAPGSIAEREHMKWQNAAPLENNPYSPENLQRRLSGKQSPGAFDYSGLSMASKHDEAAGDAGHDEVVLENKETTEPERLADVFKHEKQDFQRFGRDYYIKEAQKASGERKRRSELLMQIQQQNAALSDQESDHRIGYRTVNETFDEIENNHQLQRSRSYGDKKELENIFAARPIRVEENDPILQRATKLDALSTDERDFYIVPVEEASNVSLTSSERSLLSPVQSDRHSLSEDSDSTRIYDLNTQETKIIRENLEKFSPVQNSVFLRNRPLPVALQPKPLQTNLGPKSTAPETTRFFAPKRSPYNIGAKIMSEINVEIAPAATEASDIKVTPHVVVNGDHDAGIQAPAVIVENDVAVKAHIAVVEVEAPIVVIEATITPPVAVVEPEASIEAPAIVIEPAVQEIQAPVAVVTPEVQEIQAPVAVVTPEVQEIQAPVVVVEPVVQEIQAPVAVIEPEVSIQAPIAVIEIIEPTPVPETIQAPIAVVESKPTIANGNISVNDLPIEEELKNSLPSVRLLAQSFAGKSENVDLRPFVKPKTLPLIIPKDNENNENTSPDSFGQQGYQPMAPGYSISGRSISTQFKAELKEAANSSEPIIINNNVAEVAELTEISKPVHSSPPRSPSPVLVPGKLRSNIAFFENLKKN